jgi:hypothetical protein
VEPHALRKLDLGHRGSVEISCGEERVSSFLQQGRVRREVEAMDHVCVLEQDLGAILILGRPHLERGAVELLRCGVRA